MIRARRLEALDDSPEAVRRRSPVHHLWYAAYGSNMHLDRLTAYLAGGRPPGGLRGYPGCRDPRTPARTAPIMLPGLLYFATESQVWTGGSAFYDPDAAPARRPDGRPESVELPSCAYLLTLSQFSDIAAQEMYREPGEDLDLTEAVTRGRSRTGPGRYETLVCPGLLDGYPVLTFTAPWSSQDIAMNPPSAAYLRHIAAGIVASHGWSARRAADYLAGCPGADGHWTATEIAALLTAPA
ncbi:histone deacetylase [Streptomyces tubercidicus]|uniref:histone deacetylase n=1 Tax=Streptomyces tubercidicus TaxID=47759 RepID=UPI002E112894|nr:histone deacetylase [Streptomyces tubercidicus]WSX19293.1 histone deacetylase [Streptomyces tubercidicus]